VAAALLVPVGSPAIAAVVPAPSRLPFDEPHGLVVFLLGVVVLSLALLSSSMWRRVRLAAWRGRLPGGLGALPSESRPSHDRPRGYKVARLVCDPTSATGGFLGLTVGGLYGQETAASCEVLSGALPPPRYLGRRAPPAFHHAPDLSCTCGFYAFHDRCSAVALLSARPPVSRLFGLVLLEVDLAGTVIEFDRGYRASHQRVLGVQVPPWCVPCATSGNARRARRVAGLAGAPFEEALQADLPRYPPLYRLALSAHHTALLERLGGRAALRAVCDQHTPVLEPSSGSGVTPPVVLELADLAARLGTEVSWLDDHTFDVEGFIDAMSWLPPGNTRAA
jgi:hypothetical protein